MSKVILIYGFHLKTEECFSLKDDVKLYHIPFCGDKECNNILYVGIEFGKVPNILDKLYKVDINEKLQITNDKPSIKIINKMGNLYPGKELKCYAILQNIYTSHYVSGEIYAGFLCNHNDNIFDINLNGFTTINVSHNICDDKIFVGKQLSKDYECFEEDDDTGLPGIKLYEMLTTTYSYEGDASDFNEVMDNQQLKDFKKSKLMIAFVPSMCYCCT